MKVGTRSEGWGSGELAGRSGFEGVDGDVSGAAMGNPDGGAGLGWDGMGGGLGEGWDGSAREEPLCAMRRERAKLGKGPGKATVGCMRAPRKERGLAGGWGRGWGEELGKGKPYAPKGGGGKGESW